MPGCLDAGIQWRRRRGSGAGSGTWPAQAEGELESRHRRARAATAKFPADNIACVARAARTDACRGRVGGAAGTVCLGQASAGRRRGRGWRWRRRMRRLWTPHPPPSTRRRLVRVLVERRRRCVIASTDVSHPRDRGSSTTIPTWQARHYSARRAAADGGGHGNRLATPGYRRTRASLLTTTARSLVHQGQLGATPTARGVSQSRRAAPDSCSVPRWLWRCAALPTSTIALGGGKALTAECGTCRCCCTI